LISPSLKATVMDDFAYIVPMNDNGLLVVSDVALSASREENYGTGDQSQRNYACDFSSNGGGGGSRNTARRDRSRSR